MSDVPDSPNDLDEPDEHGFVPPVRAEDDGFVVDIDDDETALVRRLVDELRSLLTEPGPGAERLIARLFPVAYPDDDELEEEYQRLMREELVQSKMSAFDIVDELLDAGAEPVDEPRLVAFMQSINSIRLVLGTMLGVTDDPDADEVAPGFRESPEYALYGYLSWLLDHCVRALSGQLDVEP